MVEHQENSFASSNLEGDELTRSIRHSRPRLADDLVFSPLMHKGETVYHIEATSSGKFYRVGASEYVFLSLFDGETTFAEAFAVTAQRMGADALSEAQAKQVMTWMMQHHLIEGEGVPTAKTTLPSALKRYNPFFNKVRFGCPDDFFRAANAGLGWVFHPLSVTVGIGLMLLAACVWLENMDRFAACSGQVFAPSNWLWLTLSWIMLKIVHEIGHGVACKRMGGKVAEVGVMLILLAPLAYVDVTSSWRFASKWRRIGVALAGMYIELLVAALATIGWVYATSPLTEQLLYNVIITATVATVLFNANPLMRFDGYYVLSDITDTPNLYTDGTEAFHEVCRWLFFGTRRGASVEEMSKRTRLVRVYGIASAFWRIVITASIGLAAAAMFHKAGLVVVAMGAAVVAIQSAKKTSDSIGWHWRHRPASCLRAGSIAGTMLVTAWMVWAVMPNPMALTAPGILQYEGAAVVRAESSGFVTKIFVYDGQPVKAGEPLMELTNRELIAECESLAAELAEVGARESIALDEGEIAAAQVAAENRRVLERRLADKNAQRERLVVTAPVAGHVVSRQLTQQMGTYVEVGTEVLSIGNESEKEFVLSISSKEIDDALRRVGETVYVRLGTERAVAAKLLRVQPRATVELPHEALAATEGGPLAVKEANGDREGPSGLELMEPRFIANVRLAAADAEESACGQRGYARLGRRSETMGRWLVATTRDWFEAKLRVE